MMAFCAKRDIITTTFWLVLAFNMSFGDYHNCIGDNTCQSEIHCAPDEDCLIDCDGVSACEHAHFICPTDYICTINCIGDDAGCRFTTVDATDAKELHVSCSSCCSYHCYAMSIYCPPKENQTPKCFIQGDGQPANFDIYSVNGWLDMDMSLCKGTRYGAGIGTTMHCGDGYTESCLVADNGWYCDNTGPTICSHPPTSNPSISPTNNPTNDPTKNPTISPSINPTTSPSKTTQNPSETPTKQPSINPTKSSKSPTDNPTKSPTKYPSKSPTKSPTNYPTENPTKIPTKYPTDNPTKSPTNYPSKSPTKSPSKNPTTYPSKYPTEMPSKTPTQMTRTPTNKPTLIVPNKVHSTQTAYVSTIFFPNSTITAVQTKVNDKSNILGSSNLTTILIPIVAVALGCIIVLVAIYLYKFKNISTTKTEINMANMNDNNSYNTPYVLLTDTNTNDDDIVDQVNKTDTGLNSINKYDTYDDIVASVNKTHGSLSNKKILYDCNNKCDGETVFISISNKNQSSLPPMIPHVVMTDNGIGNSTYWCDDSGEDEQKEIMTLGETIQHDIIDDNYPTKGDDL